MFASNDPELAEHGKDINACSVNFNDAAEQALNGTSLAEVEEPTPRENGPKGP